MMKKLAKALLGLIAAVAMLFTGLVAPVTALAADTHTLTINNAEAGHMYEAYQVFSGTLSADGGTLSNIQWGSSVKGGDILTALQGDSAFGEDDQNVFKDVTDAAGVADKLSKYGNDSSEAKAFAKIVGNNLTTAAGTSDAGTEGTDGKYTYTIGNLADGYYLVKDKDTTVPKDGVYTDFILKIVKDTTATPKSDVPTVEKKVKDVNDSTGDTSDWQDSADHDINDAIEYKLTGTLPSNYGSYTTYAYKFTDTLSQGLTVNEDSVKVYVVNDGTETEITGYTKSVAEVDAAAVTGTYAGGHVLTVDFANLKDVAGVTSTSKIVVKYTATLNANAVIGSAGNPNKVDLTFSNNPNGDGTGKTPEDEVIVFTFKLTVNKVDGDKDPLPGAGFSLYKWNGTAYGENPVKTYAADTTTTSFDFSGLDDGQYKLVEDTAPDGYNKIADIEFKIVATHTQDDGDPARTLTVLNITDLDGNNMNGFTIDVSTKNVSTDVVNKKGSELPETGGIGTTILYVAGAVCVIAAGVWFGLRRRSAK